MYLNRLIFLSLVATIIADRDWYELTFEVENQEEFCMYHKFNESLEYLVEFGVVKGGNFDIDFLLESPSQKVLYSGKKINKRESVKFQSSQMGDFKFCFSNNFSPVTHKVVHFSLRPFDEKYRDSLRHEAGDNNLPVVLSATEYRLNTIHVRMENVSSIQRYYRIQELVDRNFADMLNFKIYIFSAVCSVTIVAVSLAQVFFLRYLFNAKPYRPSGVHETLIINNQLKF